MIASGPVKSSPPPPLGAKGIFAEGCLSTDISVEVTIKHIS